MKYYKDPLNHVYAYESDGSQDDYINPAFTPISADEAFALLEPPVEQRIAAAHARINASYEQAVNALTAGYPATEIASWPKQEEEARRFLADENAITPWLSGAATARGLNKMQFSLLIVANANALAPLHGALTGRRQVLRDQIDALGGSPTQEQLDAVQW